ncbi:GTP-binding protein [Candidatus Woesearchaeota archaeon]|nr:MAG: GTP-binding protein [Candidatus Woesearchaeota archaeon]
MAKLERNKKLDARILELEEELRTTKYNKRTQGAVGLLKAKIARLKEAQRSRASKGSKSTGYNVRKSGDATVILVGFPSVGKSTLLNSLTGTNSPVGSYAFTTLDVIPGLLQYKHAKIQILDVPGIIQGAASGKGRGKEVLSVATNADLVLILVDVFHPEHLDIVKKEVYDANIRLNKTKPIVKIAKKSKGGISIGATVKLTHLDKKTAENILREYKIVNADVVIRSDVTVDDFIDAIEGNKRYIPGIVVLNKIDMVTPHQLEQVKKTVNPDICISADKKEHLEELKELIFKKLNFIRVYCKEIGKPADLDVPMIMFKGSTLKDMCQKLHKDFVSKFRFARVWGDSVKFDGQKVLKLSHELKDNDIIEIHVS